MSSKDECCICEYGRNIHGCASKHVSLARKMISEGKIDEADKQLSGLEEHLKK
jgi:hypothetical protein